MRRVLVPLDGSDLSASIFPDARRLAGPDGELFLVHDVRYRAFDPERGVRSQSYAMDRAYDYLEGYVELLRAEGVRARAETLVIADRARSIDDAARIFEADMIACATHGRSGLGRLVHGSVAWKAIANSPVPVLVRHPEAAMEEQDLARSSGTTTPRRILVPLDGSSHAAKALPLAAELASEWSGAEHVPIYLTQVVPHPDAPNTPYQRYDLLPSDLQEQLMETQLQLDELAEKLPVAPQTHVIAGSVVERLIESIRDWGITDIVMASHGRTGLSRVIVGSVTDALIQRLHCPIIVIPSLAAEKIDVVPESPGAGSAAARAGATH